MQLGADRPKLAHRPVQLFGGGLRIVHRERGGEAGEPIWMSRDQLGEFVVGGAGELEGDGRVTELFERRDGERENLAVITEPVDRAPARVEVDQGRVFADPRAVTQDAVADRRSRGNRLHAGGVGRRKYVSEGIDLRHV